MAAMAASIALCESVITLSSAVWSVALAISARALLLAFVSAVCSAVSIEYFVVSVRGVNAGCY